jgi:ATP-dependent helicase HrpB
MTSLHAPLPIDDVLEELRAALRDGNRVALVAPPGAGKTTRVPLALLDEAFAAKGRIIVAEPRRLAARAAAARMAAMLGQPVGETIGLRVRMHSRVSRATRVEIVTEGVFTRMILDDPSLEGVAAVLFDEFHERSLDADLGLALVLETQGALRADLRVLAMSATLDGARVARLMGGAPVIESLGRAFPVETRYVGRDPALRIEEDAARVALRALGEDRGSILIFLPGQGEILRCAAVLGERVRDPSVDIVPLYGALDRATQDRAVAPAAAGRRKIVLATSIAETSLTIEGVRIVIDCGLARVPRYEPDSGVTRLETQRVSAASADQRRGRAGRTAPGVCYRLWEEAANGALAPFNRPEILDADLSGLVLDLAAVGIRDTGALAFLDPPPAPALKEARALLTSLSALDPAGAISEEGKRVAQLALPPRLARMVVDAARMGAATSAARIVVILTERGLGGDAIDLNDRLERLARDRSPSAADARALAERLARDAGARPADVSSAPEAGALLALAFPERIAKARGKPGDYLMANGRAASIEPHEALARAPMLAVGAIVGRAAAARILLAAPISLEAVETVAGAAIETRDETVFDRSATALRRRRQRRLGAIVLVEANLPPAGGEDDAVTLARGLLALGVDRLPWTDALRQWRERMEFLRGGSAKAAWPDLSDRALAADPGWLATFLIGKTALADLSPEEFDSALRALAPYDVRGRVDAEAPSHFTAPTGSRVPVDYSAPGGPAIAIRVQELFGLNAHPALAGGSAPLTLTLLSPANRPIQTTRDLPGFWRGSWADVRSEMRGRYPRHSWPENPADAVPTTRAKPRGT